MNAKQCLHIGRFFPSPLVAIAVSPGNPVSLAVAVVAVNHSDGAAPAAKLGPLYATGGHRPVE